MLRMGSLVAEPSKLYAVFQQLQFETGKLGNNEFSAWQLDLFNKEKCKFLDWFQTYIGTANCLTYSEKLDYDELCEKKLLLESTEYENALHTFALEHPGIFDLKSNVFACNALEAECEYYTEELEHLEQKLLVITGQHNKLKRKQTHLDHELEDAEFQRDEAAVTCLQYAEVADQLNAHLGKGLTICCNIFSNDSEPAETRFLCKTDVKEHREYLLTNLDQVLSSFRSELHENLDFDISLSSVSHHMEKSQISLLIDAENLPDSECSVYNNPVYNQASDVMTGRLISIFRMHNQYLQEVAICDAKLKYLTQLSRIQVLPNQLSMNFASKEMILKQKQRESDLMLASYIDELIKQTSTSYTALVQAGINSEIKCCELFECKLDQLIANQNLTLQLIQCEMDSFDEIVTFMNDMREYVTDMQQCEARIEGTKLINAEYDAYVAKPLEDKWPLLHAILNIINVKEKLPMSKALVAIKKFEDECDALEKKLYIEDIESFANELKKVEENSAVLLKFLGNQATDQLHVIPSPVHDVLRHFVASIAQEDNEIKHALGVFSKAKQNDAKKNKWLKLKSQLWMYFLKKPEKLEHIIEDIQRFVQSERAAFFNS